MRVFVNTVLIGLGVIYLSSNACEARRRHHHHVNRHHRSEHVANNHSVGLPPRRCVRDDVAVKADPPQDWSNPKEEIPFTGLTWVEMADKSRMPFNKLIHVEHSETNKQEVVGDDSTVLSALFFVFSLMALASLTIPNKPESI